MRRESIWDSIWGRRREPVLRTICTCIWYRVGEETPTTCPWWQTCGLSHSLWRMHKPDFPRRSLVCGPEDPAWFSRMVRTDGAHGVVHREDRPPPRVDHLSRYLDFTLRVRNRLRAAATSRDRTMAKSPGCRPFGPP